MAASRLTTFPSKPRVFVLTDITNEPDDAESFVRYLTYSNQFRTEGIVATTSTWLRNTVAPENLHEIVDAYEKIVNNLNAHVHPESPYPSAQYMRSIIKSGPPIYGMAAVRDDIPLSDGGKLLLERILSPDPDSLWVLVWGGPNVLAQVLYSIRDRPDAPQLRSKLRVYAISDQDDTGAWMRRQWPDIFYICSVHGWNQYQLATWYGISGLTCDSGGPDTSEITAEWVKKNIQIGPLGKVYPDAMYIIEGDTPTFLYLIQNGLGSSEQPSWGSWGGRYLPVSVHEGRGPYIRGHFTDACDKVIGLNGQTYESNHSTIWRWRSAFQNDFAARMQWTLSPNFSQANHHPVVSVNGDIGITPYQLEADAGSVVEIDASATYDPNRQQLTYKWHQYREPSAVQHYHTHEVAVLGIEPDAVGSKVKIMIPPPEKSCMRVREQIVLEQGPVLHLILEVINSGSPPLTSYRRILIQPVNRNFK